MSILVKTGTYQGNGTTKTISDVLFTPDITIVFRSGRAVMFKGSNAVWGTASQEMDGGFNASSGITAQTANGFTVGSDTNVNANGVEHHYICIKATNGEIVEGTYVGTGSAHTPVTGLSFRPAMVWTIGKLQTNALTVKTKTMGTADSCVMGTASSFFTTAITAINADGFSVGTHTDANDTGDTYAYYAFKDNPHLFMTNHPGVIGSDNNDLIHFGDFDWLTVMRSGPSQKVMRTSSMTGDQTKEISNAPSPDFEANLIQSLSPAVQFGSDSRVFGTTSTYHVFAFTAAGLGGYVPPLVIGNMSGNLVSPTNLQIDAGSYVGNGTSRVETVDFQPELVILRRRTDGGSSDSTHWKGSHMPSNTSRAFNNTRVTNGITAFGLTSFTVGSHDEVNASGVTYDWVALRNPTGRGLVDPDVLFATGEYDGDESTPRTITVPALAGVQINAVISGGGTFAARLKTSDMSGTDDTDVGQSAKQTGTQQIRSLGVGSFEIGSGLNINQSGTKFDFIAIAEGKGIDVGTYVGNGADDRLISLANDVLPAVGYVMVKRFDSTSEDAYQRFGTHDDDPDPSSQQVLNTANLVTDFIQDSSGESFEVGTSLNVNTDDYVYIAFGIPNYAPVERSLTWKDPNTGQFRTHFFIDTLSSQNFFQVRALTSSLWFGLFFSSDTNTDNGNVVRTKDGGETWDLPFAVPAANRAWQDIRRSPSGRLWGLTMEVSNQDHIEIWFSDDDGDTWTESFDNDGSGGTLDRSYYILCHPTDPDIIVTFGRTGGSSEGTVTWTTEDGGNSWTRRTVAARHNSVVMKEQGVILLASNRIVYVGFATGSDSAAFIDTSDDFGASWTRRKTLSDVTSVLEDIYGPVGDSKTGELFVMAVENSTSPDDIQIWRSVDGGTTWTQISGVAVGVQPYNTGASGESPEMGLDYDTSTGYLYVCGIGSGNTYNRAQIQRSKSPWTVWENVSGSITPLTEGEVSDSSLSGPETTYGIVVIPTGAGPDNFLIHAGMSPTGSKQVLWRAQVTNCEAIEAKAIISTDFGITWSELNHPDFPNASDCGPDWSAKYNPAQDALYVYNANTAGTLRIQRLMPVTENGVWTDMTADLPAEISRWDMMAIKP